MFSCITKLKIVRKLLAAGSAGHRAESVFVVTHTILTFSAHVLTLYYKAHFTFVKLSDKEYLQSR